MLLYKLQVRGVLQSLWAEPKRDLRGSALKEDACNITGKLRHREGAKPVCYEKRRLCPRKQDRQERTQEVRGRERVLRTEASFGLKNWTVH